MSDPVLGETDLGAAMSGPSVPDWKRVDGALVKTVTCAGFVGSLAFVNEVGALAQAADHHPDIDIRYNQVKLSLVTHDSGGITQKDIDLATRIDGVSAGVK
jgi:4a-hydroxytetrahydrobiopterin dehydratase